MIALSDFERLVEQTAGLHVDSIGASTIERGVRERQQARGVRDLEAYWTHVTRSADELQALIEAIVVPETWFFRDLAVFDGLREIAQSGRSPHAADGVFNVLSIPCSTGEEPYSIAMALLDAGMPPDRFRVFGIDISERSVSLARQGVYGRGAFRNKDLTFRDRHFTPDGRSHEISDRVRRQVRFQQGNLFEASVAGGPERFDVIFCRNLLIYFDQATQARAVERLTTGMLAPHGVLFVGSAETGVMMNRPEMTVRFPRGFGFRTSHGTAKPRARSGHRIAAVKRPAIPPVSIRTALPARVAPPRATARPTTAHKVPAARHASRKRTTAAVEAVTRLKEAERLANAGRFADAAQRCEEHLRTAGPSAQAFYLLGLVRDASGDWSSAVESYRKALYLDPAHKESLIHLALLLEQHHRKSEARVLRDRLERLTAKATS